MVPENCERCGVKTADKFRVLKPGTSEKLWVCQKCRDNFEIISRAIGLYRIKVLEEE